jgi:hypothetical protein
MLKIPVKKMITTKIHFMHEYLHSVGEIAVNPVDGRHIFASVKTTELYHSSDRGCTWKKLALPMV